MLANSIFGEFVGPKSIEKTSARNGRFRGLAHTAGYAFQWAVMYDDVTEVRQLDFRNTKFRGTVWDSLGQFGIGGTVSWWCSVIFLKWSAGK